MPFRISRSSAKEPKTIHWKIVKQIFPYEQVTKEKAWFTVTSTNCVTQRRLSPIQILNGLGFSIASRQAPMCCSTRDTMCHGKKQGLVALSTTEVEMIAVAESFTEQEAVC